MVLAGLAPAQRNVRVKQALKDYGLENRADHRPDELSGGQRQRVAIARATIMQPAMILADEPTGNLDRATGEEVIRLLEGLNAQGVTLIMVTHDNALGARAHRQLLMEDGAVKQDNRHDKAQDTSHEPRAVPT
jgi:putative ABC transport system ATP-binding protein